MLMKLKQTKIKNHLIDKKLTTTYTNKCNLKKNRNMDED